jgi:Dehydrogenases with different specificities (related to short-chain alcohol dehydrogenases)
MKLKDKVAVVTGSSSGIGEAIALALAKEGAKVVINSRRNIKGGKGVVQRVKSLGGDGIYIQADLSKPKAAEDLLSKVLEKFKKIDILINNVGDSEAGEFTDLSIWERQFKTVLLSNVTMTSEFLKQENKDLIKILNISSIYGLQYGSDPAFMAFAAMKAGINSFTINLAHKLGDNVTVNALALGYVWTKHWGELQEKWKAGIENATKLKRFIAVNEVAEMALAIIKNDAMNGQVITLDGGATLKDLY